MTYGDDKVRDMCRSILPSTSRKSDRENAEAVRRRNRRLTRQTLHDWKMTVDPDEFEGHVFGYEDSACMSNDWDGWSGQSSIKTVMWNRRDHDKLSPMLRWAVAVTSHIGDPADRREYMRRILPDNLIGRHAMSHLEFLDEFSTDDGFRYRRRYGTYNFYPELMTADDAVAGVLACLEHGQHKRLNKLLKEATEFTVRAGKYVKIEPQICLHDHDEKFFSWAKSHEGRTILEKVLSKITL